MHIKFHIENHGEPAAGLMPYYDEVTIEVKYSAGGEDGEFLEYIRESLIEWFDGSAVFTNEEWNLHLQQEREPFRA